MVFLAYQARFPNAELLVDATELPQVVLRCRRQDDRRLPSRRTELDWCSVARGDYNIRQHLTDSESCEHNGIIA